MLKQIVQSSVIVILQLILVNSLNSQLNFEQGDWASVLSKAHLSNKGIFVDFYTVWCGPCKKMDQTTFKDEELGRKFNEQFVNYKVNAESGEGINIARSFEIGAYPTMLFLDAHGVLLLTSRGYKKPVDLIHMADLATTLPPHKHLVSLLQKPEIDPTKEGLKYLIKHGREYHTADKSLYLKQLFDLLSDKEKEDRKWQKLFLHQYTSIDDENLKDALIEIYKTPTAYQEMEDDDIRLHYNLGQDLINETKEAKRKKIYKDYKRTVQRKIKFQHKLNRINTQDTAYVMMEHDLLFYGFNKELAKYEKVAIPFMEEYLLKKLEARKDIAIRKGDTDQVLFLSICDHLKTFYNKDRKKSERIIGWLDQIIEQSQLIEAYIYKARVYQQLGDHLRMRQVINEALKKPVNPQQRDRLNSMLN